MHEKADEEGVDLLLLDSGDRIEGNGLYDASEPKGRYTLKIFGEQNIDILCAGNHELYKNTSSESEYSETVPRFLGNYLASNIDIFDPKTGEQRPLAQRFKKFTTKNQGIRVLAFGFLFNFMGNSNNTIVQKVQDTVKEKWFQEAIRDREVDLFLVNGHIPLRSEEFASIFRAIREQQWDVAIQFFGGHTHIRDYAKYDNKAYGLESGRYMETIGFMSVTGLPAGGKSKSMSIDAAAPHVARLASPTFSRRYIDNNLFSYHQHTNLDATTFPTEHGRNVSSMIASARQALKLDKAFGCAPRDYWTNRAPYPSENSIFSWLQDEVLPDMILDVDRADAPRMVLINTGALRFDIFQGPFTVDTTYTVSPFTSGFRYIQDVPFSVAKRLLQIINQAVPQLWPASHSFAYKGPVLRSLRPSTHLEVAERLFLANGQAPLGRDHHVPDHDAELTPGYTTTDDAGSDGDDTLHAPITFYRVPNAIESRIGFPTSAATGDSADPVSVDIVYVDFIESYILLALKFLGTDYAERDTKVYMDGRDMTGLIAEWVHEHWKC